MILFKHLKRLPGSQTDATVAEFWSNAGEREVQFP